MHNKERIIEPYQDYFFKHLEDGIFEIRIMAGGNAYRVFAFFVESKRIILLQGFLKKTRKTPRFEIEKAKRLRKNYYENRKNKG